MNKIVLLLIILLVFGFSKGFEFDEIFYDKLVIVLKGMSKTTKYECSDICVKYKSTIFPIIKGIYESGNYDINIEKLADYLTLLMIGFVGKCKPSNIQTLLKNIKTENYIKSIGEKITEKAEFYFNKTHELIKIEDSETYLFKLGNLLSILLDFYVD